MNRPPTYKPPVPLAEAEPAYLAALEELLKVAVNVGRKHAETVSRAKRAKREYQLAVNDLRRSERATGGQGSINWINSPLGQHRHSQPFNRSCTPRDIEREITAALDALKEATW